MPRGEHASRKSLIIRKKAHQEGILEEVSKGNNGVKKKERGRPSKKREAL